jgi:uncharacterized protein (DUF4415 family)
MNAKPDPYLTDDDNPELTDEQIMAMRPASEVLPPALYKKLLARSEARRAARETVTLHLDPAVAARLRAEGPDWEDRAAAILREAVGL